MIILGLDMSKRNSGWAGWGDDMPRPVSGGFRLGHAITDDGITFARVHQHLDEIRQLLRFDHIVVEEPLQPQALGQATTFMTLYRLYGIVAHVESYAAARGCKVHRANQSAWRAHFLKGLARPKARSVTMKDLAMRRCRELDLPFGSDDEAEALGILDYGCWQNSIIPPWRRHESLLPDMGL